MDIYGVNADKLVHCVALHVIKMKIDKIIVRNAAGSLLIMERTGQRAAMFPLARALISPLPSDDMARAGFVLSRLSGPTQLPKSGPLERVDPGSALLEQTHPAAPAWHRSLPGRACPA